MLRPSLSSAFPNFQLHRLCEISTYGAAIRQGLRPLRTRPRMPALAYVCTASTDVTVVRRQLAQRLTSASFSEKDQRRLSEVYRRLDKKGCLLMLSNSYSDFILELYDGYRIEQVSAKRMINCKVRREGQYPRQWL